MRDSPEFDAANRHELPLSTSTAVVLNAASSHHLSSDPPRRHRPKSAFLSLTRPRLGLLDPVKVLQDELRAAGSLETLLAERKSTSTHHLG